MEEKAFCNFLYEKDNHLGNVLSVISDKVIPYDDVNDGDVDWFLSEIRHSGDFSPFGVELSGRTFDLSGAGDYRYAFQGQESDDEIKGEGNSLNYKYRMHDPRLGRFFAIDPLASEFPWNSPYAFSENKVINAVELEGLESAYVYNVTYSGKEKKVKKSHNYENNNSFNQRVYRYFNANGEVVKEMVQKLNSEGKAISTRYATYGSDGNPTTQTTPLLSKSTIGEKESISDKLPAFMKDGNMEGGDDAGNRGAEMYGKKGFYEKGIPLMAGTLGTILTGGLGAGAFGSGFASTYIGSSLIGGSISATGNAGGQYLASDNKGEIDGASVVGSFASGFIPGGNACKSFALNTGLSGLDASFDLKLNGSFSTYRYGKSGSTIASDFFFGMVSTGTGSAIGKSGVSNNIINTRNFVVGGTTQYINNEVNDQLKR